MHESSVAENILDIVKKYAGNHTGSPREVVLELGTQMTLSTDHLRESLRERVTEQPFDDVQFTFNRTPVRVSCTHCGYEGDVPDEESYQFHESAPVLMCPKCDAPANVTEGGHVTVSRIVMSDT